MRSLWKVEGLTLDKDDAALYMAVVGAIEGVSVRVDFFEDTQIPKVVNVTKVDLSKIRQAAVNDPEIRSSVLLLHRK